MRDESREPGAGQAAVAAGGGAEGVWARVRVAAFGQVTELAAPPAGFLVSDTLWRLRQLYGPALAAAAPLPARGVAVDIGAGFGGFALPFARAFPGWTVWCFEPEPEAFAALSANVAVLGLGNVRTLPFAVGPDPAPGPAGEGARAGASEVAAGPPTRGAQPATPPPPDMPAPDMPAPDMPAPGAPAPDSGTPESLSPESRSPESPSPESLSPEAPAAETPSREAPSPESLSPEALAPETPSREAPSPEALAPETPSREAPSPEAPAADTADGFAARARPAPFRRPEGLAGYLEAGAAGAGQVGTHYLTLPAGEIAALAPDLVKLIAPGAEPGILAALAGSDIAILIGETWAPVPPALAYGRAGRRLVWLPVAGDGLLQLRRIPARPGRREGLDVVVPTYNARGFVGDCVAAILSGAGDAVRVIVVDDGSTDGSGEAVARRFADDARVRVHAKENAGCASARNRGRMLSDATHIAFADADDLPGPGLYAGLLDLARYTGAEVVQGGFTLLHAEADGSLRAEPSYEAGLAEFARLAWRPFAGGRVAPVPAELLMIGQPSIWRRVYRRDFLDAKDIWFPEHIRAFDDLLFQHLTLAHARSVPMAEHLTYGYRQHPGQDIRQGDERAFYALEMFRLLARRALAEGWTTLPALLRSYANTVGWSWGGLRPDLRPRFAAAAAELWAALEGALGAEAFAGVAAREAGVPGFAGLVRAARLRLRPEAGAALAWLDAPDRHVPLLRAAARRAAAGPAAEAAARPDAALAAGSAPERADAGEARGAAAAPAAAGPGGAAEARQARGAPGTPASSGAAGADG